MGFAGGERHFELTGSWGVYIKNLPLMRSTPIFACSISSLFSGRPCAPPPLYFPSQRRQNGRVCLRPETYSLLPALFVLPYGSVGAELLDCVGQFACYAALDAAVCFVPGVAGIDLYGHVSKLPASNPP